MKRMLALLALIPMSAFAGYPPVIWGPGNAATVLPSTFYATGATLSGDTSYPGSTVINSSGYLGIGTTSPQAVFHSKDGASTLAGIFETQSASGSWLSFADTGTSSYTRVQLGSTGNNLVAVMNGTEAMRIDSSGNVGIGTTAATSKLTVSANTAAPQSPGTGTTVHVVGADANPGRFVLDAYGGNANFIYRRANGTAAAPTAVNTSAPIGSVAFFGYGSTGYSATNRAYINVIPSETWTDTAQGTTMYFGTTTTGTTTVSEKLRIGNDGNIGIGNISDAASRLEILAPGVTAGTDEQISLRSSRAAIVSGNMIGGINFKSNDSSLTAPGTVVALVDAVATATHTAAALDTAITFQTTTGTTMAERMRIAADGTVGIGMTPSSGDLLDVAGGVRSIRSDNAKFVVQNTGSASTWAMINRTGALKFEEGATPYLSIASGGAASFLNGLTVAKGLILSQTAGSAPAAAINFAAKDTTPTDPSSSSDANLYVKGGKLVVQYNDAGTVRYKYLDLTGTGVTWTHSTSAP